MKKQAKPKGKEAVMTAILEAATTLFAEKGPSAVSIRDIAAKAGVNHGLIHRHFGSKENLRLQVQHSLMKKINEDIGEPESYADAVSRLVKTLRNNDAFWKFLIRTFLDKKFSGDVEKSFPFLRKMVDFVTEAMKDNPLALDIDPRILAAGSSAMALGLLVFEKYLFPGTGLDEEPPEIVQEKILNTYMYFFISKDKKIPRSQPK